MSKKTKGWLIAALCLIAAGGVFIAVGQGLGAASADETRTGIGIIDGFHINVGSPVRLGWGSGGNSGSEKQEIITFTAEETASIEELDVEWNAGKLENELISETDKLQLKIKEKTAENQSKEKQFYTVDRRA